MAISKIEQPELTEANFYSLVAHYGLTVILYNPYDTTPSWIAGKLARVDHSWQRGIGESVIVEAQTSQDGDRLSTGATPFEAVKSWIESHCG